MKQTFLSVAVLLLFFTAGILFHSPQQPVVGQYDLSSESPGAYGKIDDLKSLFQAEVLKNSSEYQNFSFDDFKSVLKRYNTNAIESDADPIDQVLSLLPKGYRSHYTMVHRSYSIQHATPMSPRVILFGKDAQLVMTFNAGVNERGEKQNGGNSLEIMSWDVREKTWDFSEVTFEPTGRALLNENPQKCALCHAGTPKPINLKNIEAYRGKLKPIFPQYPFWPGFYGSVNDIVADHSPGSRDTIMRNIPATIAQVKGLTFSTTEELFRLEKLLDTNPEYRKVIESEFQTHRDHFPKLMTSLKERPRYRHLVSLKDLYTDKNMKVPLYLSTAPYRRTFEKEYGHYILRPNFYFSSLLTFLHAQFVAKQIQSSEPYQKIKHSLLARKFNCGDFQVPGLKLSDLDPSFDLLYPNQSSQEARDRQFLLAYQYNLEGAYAQKHRALPLFAWNMESNEDIASYHYGNVFSDLNELVLWNLARSEFPQILPQHSKSAAEDRHYLLPPTNYFKIEIDRAGGFVSKMNNPEFAFANTMNSYYGTSVKFNAQPASAYCKTLFLPAAKKELTSLVSSQDQKSLPHLDYKIDSQLTAPDTLFENQRVGINMVRQTCEGCHSDNSIPPSERIQPRINVDWFTEEFASDLKEIYEKIHTKEKLDLRSAILQVLSPQALPVPYGNAMPYARRSMEDFSLKCEIAIIEANFKAERGLKAKVFNCDREKEPNSFGCQCQRLNLRRDGLFKKYFAQ
jgi:hypothetical protein